MVEKAKIDGQIYDVIDYPTFIANPEAYGYNSFTAIQVDGMLYPVRSKTDIRPGFYPGGGKEAPMDFFREPKPDQVDAYSQAINGINFSDAATLREVIAAQQRLNNAERTILTTIDNVFVPVMSAHDTPEMHALKQAVAKKKVDIDKYEPRFGPNYNNDKRLFNKNSITFGKLRTMMDALDMKGTLILEDINPDVPNPIGERIIVQLNNGGESEELDETQQSETP